MVCSKASRHKCTKNNLVGCNDKLDVFRFYVLIYLCHVCSAEIDSRRALHPQIPQLSTWKWETHWAPKQTTVCPLLPIHASFSPNWRWPCQAVSDSCSPKQKIRRRLIWATVSGEEIIICSGQMFLRCDHISSEWNLTVTWCFLSRSLIKEEGGEKRKEKNSAVDTFLYSLMNYISALFNCILLQTLHSPQSCISNVLGK